MHDFVIPEGLPEFIQDHVKRYLESDGADGHWWDSRPHGGDGVVPTLLLTATGRKTGLSRTLPIGYTEHESAYVIVGSKGGAPTHPAWFLNLEANPEVSIQVGSDRFEARARAAVGDERAQLWLGIVTKSPVMQTYQDGTDREIPVVILERV